MVPGETERVEPPDQHVARLENEGDISRVDHPLDLVRGLHEGVDVGVEDLGQAVPSAHLIEPADVGEHLRPLILAERRALPVVGVGHDTGDEVLGAGRGEHSGAALRDLELLIPTGGVGEGEGVEASGETESVGVEQRSQLGGIGRQVTDGAELGGRESEPGHLGEHPGGRELLTPAGHLADTPGDRRGADAG